MTKVLPAVLLAAVSTAAVPFSVRYAGELGPRLSLSWARPAGKNTLSGQDQDGKPWRVALPGNYASAAVFESDLDGNRQADLVIINTVAGEPVCGTAASDVTMMLRDAKGHPSPWQSTMRLARTQREDELPFLLTDHNGDGFAEIAVVECAGETPVLEGIYEVRPEGVVPLPRRAYAGYAGDLKKLYRNKNLSIPGEDSPPLTANEGSAAATLDRIATQEWGGNAAPAEVVLSTGEKISGWPRLGPAQAGFQRTYSTGDGVADLLEVAARRTLVKADPGGMLRTHPAASPWNAASHWWKRRYRPACAMLRFFSRRARRVLPCMWAAAR